MAKPELGTKRVDPETGRKFYDLNKDPIVSPFTGKEYPLSFFEAIKAAPSRSRAAAPRTEDETENENTEVADTDEETVSINDIDEDDDNGKDDLPDVDGDDDDGAPIHARVRTGLTSFGTEVLKKNPNMYLTLRSDGELLLRVITTDGGRKKENWYKLHRREATEPVEGRFDIAKGLTSVYWGYQIENIAGADFELATIKSWPFVVQRRKSGR